MIKEYNYIPVQEVLSRVLRHPLLQDVSLEQAVQYTIDFIGIFGLPTLYTDKEETLHIKDFRCMLPCDIISINQIKDCKTGVCLRSMSDTFNPMEYNGIELSFKTQGSILYTSFKEGDITLSYKSIPVDKDGFPLLIDNSVFLKALEAYIKKEVFSVLFDLGKLNQASLQNAQQQYAWLAGQLNSEFSIPSISEMESIKNMWCQLLPRTKEYQTGFKTLGKKFI